MSNCIEISDYEVVDEIHYVLEDSNQPLLRILKRMGAPIKGLFLLKFDPDFDFQIDKHCDKAFITVKWRQNNG